MIGKKFGRLTVEKQIESDLKGNLQYLCVCECGKQRSAVGVQLRSGKVKSCGCLRGSHFAAKKIEMTGRVFGEWTVKSKASHYRKWNCVCSCGIEREVDGGGLRSGATVSCGHLARQHQNENLQAIRDEIVGESFGLLTVIKTYQKKGEEGMAFCECACGNTKESLIKLLVNGMTKSCGCLNSQASRERAITRNKNLILIHDVSGKIISTKKVKHET